MFFFFNDTATTEIYTLSLHDALPILDQLGTGPRESQVRGIITSRALARVVRSPLGRYDIGAADRKSTRLNSSHGYISYAVFCLKKKSTTGTPPPSSPGSSSPDGSRSP